ncbi:hypothetical protein LXL04_025203 [Taraxacum kok-saghyz]
MHMYVKCSLCVFMLNRGEALSSISDVSLLQVVTVGIRQQMVKKNCTTKSALISTVTKAHGMPNGYCKVIKCSKCLYLGIDDDRQDVGTTVVVRDLFYNQLVRRRHLQSRFLFFFINIRMLLIVIDIVFVRRSRMSLGWNVKNLKPKNKKVPRCITKS